MKDLIRNDGAGVNWGLVVITEIIALTCGGKCLNAWEHREAFQPYLPFNEGVVPFSSVAPFALKQFLISPAAPPYVPLSDSKQPDIWRRAYSQRV